MHVKQFFYALVPVAILALTSCKTSKQLPYFQDLPQSEQVSRISTSPYQPLRLQTNDEIQVTISSASAEASQFFNLMANAQPMTASSITATSSQAFNNLYHVSFTGSITIPVLGDINVIGLTTDEVKAAIMEKLKDYLKDPVVIVKLTNFKVTVIGEVNKPVIVPVNGQTINVIEAIGASGDMTVFGIRKNVRVIRRLPDGSTEVATLDFNKSNVMQSPYFQLKQNDIVYIQPNKNKGLQGSRSNIWIPIVSTVVSVAAIIIASRH